MHLPKSRLSGFTLVELIVVLAILSIILALVLVAINPAKRLSDAADTQRWSDINNILNAINQYAADNKNLPPGVTTTAMKLSSPGATGFCNALVNGGYLAVMPVDNSDGGAFTDCNNFTTGGTGYTVVRLTNGSVQVSTQNSSGPIKVVR